MAELVNEDSVVESSVEGEALAKSFQDMKIGNKSTLPSDWDIDDDDYHGPKPSELYGNYTWKIDKFSKITERELRSNVFDIGGCKWCISIYPHGHDVSYYISLFLCVANHDELLPGWSHFAQFTIVMVNKDPKKSKYSDTVHRFWRKEHDWGWKKFIERPRVYDGFVDTSDNLIIKVQVQVLRYRNDKPFRCLDSEYRREIMKVYLTNAEEIYRRFVSDRISKLEKFMEDKTRWSSFCSFWQEIDQTSRNQMSREKTDIILKAVIKQFFIEKEITSTIVMDSLYHGLKALEGRKNLLGAEEMSAPIVRVENDMFLLVDDVILLLQRASVEALSLKYEKGPQNQIKVESKYEALAIKRLFWPQDGNTREDFNEDSMEHDERRLTKFGYMALEIFVLSHIFSNKIEVSYQEAIALKRQEALIREESGGIAG